MILYYLYVGLLYLFFPFFLIRIYARQRQSPQNKGRLKERLGFFNVPNKLINPIWFHAVSYGEAVLAEQLIKAVLTQHTLKHSIVVTTTTFTGFERIYKAFGKEIFHVYLPYDLPSFIQRFLKKINPKLLVILETELWPSLIRKTRKKQIPVFLANARLSEKSVQNYTYIAPLIRWMLKQLTCVAAQSELDASRFLKLGLPSEKLMTTGSIKFDLIVPKIFLEQGRELRKLLGTNRLVWIAASTHAKEEEKVLHAFQVLRKYYPNALLILAPRHPERFEEVAQLCCQKGYRIHKRSARVPLSSKIDIFLGDTLGELLIFYSAADIAFVGGSFTPIGGHNVLEPIALNVPVFIGPYFFNFSDIVKNLKDKGAIQVVEDPFILANQIKRLVENSEEKETQLKNAQKVLNENKGALEKHLKWIYTNYDHPWIFRFRTNIYFIGHGMHDCIN